MRVTSCSYAECEKANHCKRFLNQNHPEAEPIKFHNLCYKENDFQWYWKDPSKLQEMSMEGGDSL